MAGVTVTEERQLVMDFSDSYATGVQVVIVKERLRCRLMDNLGEQDDRLPSVVTTGYIYSLRRLRRGSCHRL